VVLGLRDRLERRREREKKKCMCVWQINDG
jgi:hypothetical protein